MRSEWELGEAGGTRRGSQEESEAGRQERPGGAGVPRRSQENFTVRLSDGI
jgi:hypothetical protein